MEINLSKQTRVSLAKEDGSVIKNLFVGINWGKNTYSGEENFDADLIGFVTDVNRQIKVPEDILYAQLSTAHPSGVIKHGGDNLDGSDEVGVSFNNKHFDEAIYVYTDKMPNNKDVITIGVTIYNAHRRFQNFGMLRNLRVDIIDMDNPDNLKYVPSFNKHMNVNGIHEYLKELKENTFSKYDIMTVGEANGVKAEQAIDWVGENDGKFNMLFQFEHID